MVPSSDGKDQESTSEELNLLYGIQSLREGAKRRVLNEDVGPYDRPIQIGAVGLDDAGSLYLNGALARCFWPFRYD